MTLQQWLSENDDTDKSGGHISEQWTGIDEYGNTIRIDNITAKSGKKLLWRCNLGHEWYAKVLHRTSCLSGCPVCSRLGKSSRMHNAKLKQGINDLETWCLNNGDWGKKIAREFTGITEDKNKISINDITYGCSIKLLWRCQEEHKWYATVGSRTVAKSNCPYCSGTLTTENNNLYSWCVNNNRNDLIEQFVGEYADGTKIDIHDILSGSSLKVKWKHTLKSGDEHLWTATVKHRTRSNSMCPYCNGSKKIMKGFNDLETWCNKNIEFGQIIKKEFTGVDINENIYTIDSIAPFSYKKLLWRHYTKSGEKHEWYATLYNRTSHKTLCPLCNNKGTSLPEQIIYRCIKQVYPDTISRGKFQGYEFDITIPELKTCIEYGSTYYHNERQERDAEKHELCKKYNVNLIQIIDDSNSIIDETWSKNLIVTRIVLNKISCIEKIIKHLCKTLEIDYQCIDFKVAVNDAIEFINN